MNFSVYILKSEKKYVLFNMLNYADVAQSVEHILGKDEVTGSIPVVSSKIVDETKILKEFLK